MLFLQLFISLPDVWKVVFVYRIVKKKGFKIEVMIRQPGYKSFCSLQSSLSFRTLPGSVLSLSSLFLNSSVGFTPARSSILSAFSPMFLESL